MAAPKQPTCRVCGCTDDNACLDGGTGPACHWVEEDLCSACVVMEAAQTQIDVAKFRMFFDTVSAWNGILDGKQMELAANFFGLGFDAAREFFGTDGALVAALESSPAGPEEREPPSEILLPGREF